MTFALSDEDRELQARARSFVDDELIPYEVEAELNGGSLPQDVFDRHAKLARELGFTAINMPKELGGAGYSVLQQALVQEQTGRVTNALGWVVTTPAGWLPRVATEHQMERWVLPTIRGERHECYTITEDEAGSDVDGIRATTRSEGDEYVLNGEKWHVTSANVSDYCFFQAKLPSGDHAMFIVDLDTPGIRTVRTPAYTHNYAHHHPILAFEDVVVPAENLIGREGDGMVFTREWFRYERLMIAARCCGAAERLIAEATDFASGRDAFGSSIADFQAIQIMLADSVTELWAAAR